MNKRIMIVDDDEDTLDMMREIFQYAGFEVCCQSNVSDIFKMLSQHKPDVLLIDYLLKGINGGEICALVKNNQATSCLPVVIVSAYPRVIGSLGYYDCDAFIAKPFDIDQLTNTIHQLIASAQKHSITNA